MTPILSNRKEEVLAFIIREHQKTTEPVASEVVKEKAGLQVSPATIRNEMVALEKAGYLRQPHTSAGRVPTEVGYRYYVEHCVEKKDMDEDVKALQEIMRSSLGDGASFLSDEFSMKQLARSLASAVREGVFVGFTPQSSYYTGLSFLFEQPEFESVDLVRHLSEIIDNLDRIISELFEELTPGVRVYVGLENPFGTQCGTVLLKAPEEAGAILGVLGPMRMDYDHTIAMLNGIEKTLWKS